MKTTTASGLSLRTWSEDSWPQSTRKLLEMPEPRCGSRSTFTPAGASERASEVSSGVDSESPVTSSVFSGFGAGGFSPSAAGSNASGVTGGTPVVCSASVANEPLPSRLSSGRTHAVASSATWANGSASAIAPAGLPTNSTTSRPIPGFICSPARRAESPAKTTSSAATRNVAQIASRARKRDRPCWSKRPIRLSS